MGNARVSCERATGPQLKPPPEGFKPGASRAAWRLHRPVAEGTAEVRPWAHGAPSPPSPRGSRRPRGGLMPLPPAPGERAGAGGDKESFEGFGDVSQGLAVPLRRGARAGASRPPQLMALSFIFCLWSVWSSSAGSQARRLPFWPAEGRHPSLLGIVVTAGSSPVCPCCVGGARWAARLGRGALAWLVPRHVSGWSQGFQPPLAGGRRAGRLS